MRDFKAEHSRRQQKKKRLSFEVDRQQYEQFTQGQQKTLGERIRQIIRELGRRLIYG